MNVLQILALVFFISGIGLWLSSRKKQAPASLGLAASGALIISVLLGIAGAFMPSSEPGDIRYSRVNTAQWEYPIQQLCTKINNSGKICVVVPPETESGSDIAFLKPFVNSGCTLEACHLPKTGLSASFLQGILAKNPQALILTCPLPNTDEHREAFLAAFTEKPIKVPMLFTAQVRQDALLLFSAHSLWGYVECKPSPNVDGLTKDSPLTDVFNAAYTLYDEKNRPSDSPPPPPKPEGGHHKKQNKTSPTHPDTETEE